MQATIPTLDLSNQAKEAGTFMARFLILHRYSGKSLTRIAASLI